MSAPAPNSRSPRTVPLVVLDGDAPEPVVEPDGIVRRRAGRSRLRLVHAEVVRARLDDPCEEDHASGATVARGVRLLAIDPDARGLRKLLVSALPAEDERDDSHRQCLDSQDEGRQVTVPDASD